MHTCTHAHTHVHTCTHAVHIVSWHHAVLAAGRPSGLAAASTACYNDSDVTDIEAPGPGGLRETPSRRRLRLILFGRGEAVIMSFLGLKLLLHHRKGLACILDL